jgi:hypothetical protein
MPETFTVLPVLTFLVRECASRAAGVGRDCVAAEHTDQGRAACVDSRRPSCRCITLSLAVMPVTVSALAAMLAVVVVVVLAV